jgi:outer membrane protein assembly factor BamD (BamD/ComL family)
MVKKITISFLFMFLIFVLFSQNRKSRKDYDLIKNNQFEEAYTNLSDIRNKEMYTPFSYFLFSEYFGNINNKKYNIDSCFWYLKKSYTLSKSYVDKKELEDACEDIKFCILKLNNKLDSIADFAYQKKYSTTNNLNDLNYFISFYTETKSNIKAKERLDMLLFNNAKSKKSIQSLEKFIQDYPQSQFLDSSKLEIEKLEYNDVIIKNDVVSFDQFLKKYPNSTFKIEINKKKQKKIFDTYLLMNKENEFNIYIEKYPDSDFIAEAKKKRDLLVYEESLVKNTIDGYSSVLTKYPDIEYAQQIKFNLKKLETIITEEKSTSNEDIKSENGIPIVVSGQGRTLLEAKQNAIKSAIEQAYGAFITSKTEIFNDKIVSDEMTSISSGNIKSFDIITELKQLDSTYTVILKVFVSVDKLISFVNSKGYKVDIQGSLFALNINQQILNEEAEIKNVIDLMSFIHEPLQKSFDYNIKSKNPISIDENNINWKIPLEISITTNKNYEISMNYFWNVLNSISLKKNEIENYKSLNKKVYQILINRNKKIDTVYLRKEKSLFILSSLYNNLLFYIYNFKVDNKIDSNLNCFISKLKNDNKFNSESTILIKNIGFPYSEEYNNRYNNILFNQYFNLTEYYSATTYHDFSQYYSSDSPIKNLYFKIIDSGDTISKFNFNDIKTLSQIKNLSSYSILPQNIISKINNGGIEVVGENDEKIVFAPYIMYYGDWKTAKNNCENLNLNGFSDWQLPTIKDMKYIDQFLTVNNLSFILQCDLYNRMDLWSSNEYKDFWGEDSKASFYNIITKEEFSGNCEGCPGHKSHELYFYPVRKY